ncbi:hypothetical protein DF134_19185 [Burkholderia stagnalis]|uniref:hypothetical protein n=1 Tax=Burkholderia stagnalis TaxID=1503054 RepID=UPI000F5AE26E|nr:hypothetical protein [Burkholderia stagnalis]RQQ88704.1 hypothetical protein DF134_19185 [Burkholderia stagnalis]
MSQFFADQIDQLDLALDQLAVRDRNFDRFALMLIDNVVELTLHQQAQDISVDAKMYPPDDGPRFPPARVAEALGPYFDAKVRLAQDVGLISEEQVRTIKYLHGFRNTAYHRGARHEGILHALAVFYARVACELMKRYRPMFWLSSSADRISHRVVKYLGSSNMAWSPDTFQHAWQRLADVAAQLGDTLVDDLSADMAATIEWTGERLVAMADYPMPASRSLDEVVVDCQVWPTAFSELGEKYASEHGGPAPMTPDYLSWITQHYPWTQRTNPIPSWRKRLTKLSNEKSVDAALVRYCEFMQQTETLRAQIDMAADQLEAHIQMQVDSQLLQQHGMY